MVFSADRSSQRLKSNNSKKKNYKRSRDFALNDWGGEKGKWYISFKEEIMYKVQRYCIDRADITVFGDLLGMMF